MSNTSIKPGSLMRRGINMDSYKLVISVGKVKHESPVYVGLAKTKEKVQHIFSHGRWVSEDNLYIPVHKITSVQIVKAGDTDD